MYELYKSFFVLRCVVSSPGIITQRVFILYIYIGEYSRYFSYHFSKLDNRTKGISIHIIYESYVQNIVQEFPVGMTRAYHIVCVFNSIENQFSIYYMCIKFKLLSHMSNVTSLTFIFLFESHWRVRGNDVCK